MPRGRRLFGSAGLLREVRGGVVTGDRVHRQQEPERHHVEPEFRAVYGPAGEAGFVGFVAEDVGEARVVGGHGDQQHDDRQHADDVPPHRDAVEHRHDLAAEHVHDQGEHEDGREQREVDVRGVVEVGSRGGLGEVEDEVHFVEPERVHQERRRYEDHRRGYGHQPDQVEPAGEPAPAGASQFRGPVVDPAGGGHRRGELRHRPGDEQDQHADQRPRDRDPDRAPVLERLAVGREAAGEDADDRERDREIREAAPAAIQLLLVPELGQALLVLV